MARLGSWALSAGLAVALLVGVTRLFPQTGRALGLGVSDVPHLMTIMAREEQVSASLTDRKRATLTRIEARNAVLDQLVAGRLSVPEAAERFHELNEAAAREQPGVRPIRAHAAEGDAEVYRDIMVYLARRPPRDGEDTGPLLVRLEMAAAEARR
jgi:hypothetical protein